MATNKHIGLIDRKKTAFAMLDVQERIVPAVSSIDHAMKNMNILLKAAQILKIPILVTEQYPKGLGPTAKGIELPNISRKFEKISLSCFDDKKFAKKIRSMKIKSLVLFGVEAHVCILKTALDALKSDLEVHVIADAVTSRTEENKQFAIERMKQSGVFIASTEMVLFQLMKQAGNPEFKAVQALIK